MEKSNTLEDLSLIFTIFSMFFGAGNAVFPLVLGVSLGDQVSWGSLGILGSGIALPLLGVLAVCLCKGSIHGFLGPIGKCGSQLISIILILLLGPVVTLPRCITIAHASLESYLPGLSLSVFSLIFCVLCFACLLRPSFVTTILGRILSPVLVCCLLATIVFGLGRTPGSNPTPVFSAVFEGFQTGYNTLDLLAAIFFAPTIWILHKSKGEKAPCKKRVIRNSTISFIILGGIYYGLARVSAGFAPELQNCPQQSILSSLSSLVLGEQGALIANIAIILACLTTVVGLTLTLSLWAGANFNLKKQKTNYLIILMISCIVAQSGFSGIMKLLAPIVTVIYPAIIGFTFWSICYSLLRRQATKSQEHQIKNSEASFLSVGMGND
ncbi:MAG: branched-chain amino acid transport system II carrier protein [Oligoflexales bacterium]|nr:branched-chain amino acid transport system II carrier protein [Oligoflexales bacterium]